jgi:hypothetical protein
LRYSHTALFECLDIEYIVSFQKYYLRREVKRPLSIEEVRYIFAAFPVTSASQSVLEENDVMRVVALFYQEFVFGLFSVFEDTAKHRGNLSVVFEFRQNVIV